MPRNIQERNLHVYKCSIVSTNKQASIDNQGRLVDILTRAIDNQ